jgi:outer membrane protein assembly factor BamB
VVELEIRGSSQIPSQSVLQYYAIARYDSDAQRNVTGDALWSVTPASLASVEAGVLSTGTLQGDEAILNLAAEYSENETLVQAEKAIQLVPKGSYDEPEDAWPTYQGNRGHTGYVPTTLEPEVFTLRWQRTVGPGRALEPVAAADGKVFVSVSSRFATDTAFFALDARDGEELWSKTLGRVNSVNPPAYAYGNVYLQTGKESSSGIPPYLYAFEAETGDLVFQSRFSAQWESYFAPTVFDGHVYANGGYYGGMYSFDAFSGEQDWFEGLPQYDDWTPAVDERYAYAYVGSYSPGLYVVDRITGDRVFVIPDNEFDWNGWSMNLAPVLGGRENVLAIHDGRLISFDIATRRIGWQRQSDFSGQPSVRDGVIYAIDAGHLVAVDEASGTELWSWTPPGGAQLAGALIVTDTHLFAATATTTYALELLSRDEVWSYPAAGHLALGNETLYIAASDGTLTAIAMPEYTPAALLEIDVSGPPQAEENSTVQFNALARYDDGRVRDRTHLTEWSVQPADVAGMSEDGALTIGELLVPSVAAVVTGRYQEGGVQVEDEFEVELVISVSIDEFVRRNLEDAKQLKEQALVQLGEAGFREDAARSVLEEIRQGRRDGPPSRKGAQRTLRRLKSAIMWGQMGERFVERSAEELAESLAHLD